MRFDLRHRAIRTAFLGALLAGGTALAAEPAPPPTGHAESREQKGSAQPGAARATKPSAPAPAAARSEQTAAPVPRVAGTPAAPAPASGPKAEARRGRGHF